MVFLLLMLQHHQHPPPPPPPPPAFQHVSRTRLRLAHSPLHGIIIIAHSPLHGIICSAVQQHKVSVLLLFVHQNLLLAVVVSRPGDHEEMPDGALWSQLTVEDIVVRQPRAPEVGPQGHLPHRARGVDSQHDQERRRGMRGGRRWGWVGE